MNGSANTARGQDGLVLVTGGAGFIGSHVARRLLAEGGRVRVLDNFDGFYDPGIKRRRARELAALGGERLQVVEGDLLDAACVQRCARDAGAVIHLAALAGVRPSIAQPARYLHVNVVGTQHVLDAVRGRPEVKVLFASSSSVYGGRTQVPFHESDPVDRPVSPYAASKRAGELLCATHHHLHGNPLWALRFFTVYGPGQRPEMAIASWSRLLLEGKPLPFFGDGSSRRDYTYIDDITDGVVAALARVQGFGIYNLGGAASTTLLELVALLEQAFGRKASLERRPAQPGDVPATCADTSLAERAFGYRARVPLREGLRRYADWFLAERGERSRA
jgi:UDP-glucuronate 4-epimerase